MTATIERPSLNSVMSVIFPTQPAKLNIHGVPENAQFFSYSVEDCLTISSWMPDGFDQVSQKIKQSHNDFYNDVCEGCHRNCYSYLDAFRDEDGYLPELDSDDCPDEIRDHCWVYDEGYTGQDCPEGHSIENKDYDFPISNMVFEVKFNHIGDHNYPRFTHQGDSAYLCAGKVDPDTKAILCTDIRMAANVFGHEDYVEGICWGYNARPKTLAGIVSSYTSTTFNNDLTPINIFSENCDWIRTASQRRGYYSESDIDIYLCDGGVDGLVLLDVENDIQAFFTFLIAGFKSLEQLPHIMIVPVIKTEYVMDGTAYQGYKTIPDAVGRHWFISMDGFLLGQM